MTPLIIDCDPGIDDALALLLAAASPEFDLLAVTTVAGNRPVQITSDNACRVLDLGGRSDVPVYSGCGRPLARAEPRCNLVHGEGGLGGVVLPYRRGPVSLHACDALVQALLDRPAETVTIVAVGPLTNLALAEIKSPGVLRRARAVLIMGGAAFCPGNITPAAEFNFYADPLSADVVMSSGANLTLFGLDVTSRAVMSQAWIESLRGLGNRSGEAAATMLASYCAQDPLLHDACPVAHLLSPSLFAGLSCTVSVDWRPGPTEGQCLVWQESREDRPFAANARVITEVDNANLLGLVYERIARLP